MFMSRTSVSSSFSWKLAGLAGLLMWSCACAPDAEEGIDTEQMPPPDEEQGTFIEEGDEKADANGVEEASYDGICVLSFVNEGTEEEILDAVHAWPGEAIVAAKRGDDGVFGTSDDRKFDTLEELDAVDWVGRITFGQLKRRAETLGHCLELSEEYVLPGEEMASFRIAERAMKEVDKKKAEDADGLARRDAHPKSHGCVKAFVEVEQGLDARHQVGVFASPGKVYPAWIRVSNGSFNIQSDLVGDIRGFALKVMDVPGDKVLEHKRDARTQDFLFINSPTMFVRTPLDYVELAGKTFDGNPATFFLSLDPREWKIRELRNLLGATTKQPMNPLRSRYWSTTPYMWGEGGAVKHSVRPCDGEDVEGRIGDESENFLREAMGVHLSQTEGCFEFLVQLQKDAESMPIEDATIPWQEEFSPFVKVATVRIPMQEFDTKEQDELCEHLSFNPWHTLPEHRPLGNINRTRRIVYDMISAYRHQLNGVSEREPEGHEF